MASDETTGAANESGRAASADQPGAIRAEPDAPAYAAARETAEISDDERRAYLDEMVRARGYVLPFHKPLAKQDFGVLRAFNGLLEATYFAERTLDRRTKELLFCATLTVARASRGQIQSHVRAALDAGATPGEVLEAIELTLPEAGVVPFQEAFEAWRIVVGAEGIEPSVAVYDPSAEPPRT